MTRGQPFPDELKRDSGFAPSTTRPSHDGDASVPRVPSLPTIVVHDEPQRPSTANNVSDLENISRCRSIETDIPKGDFDDLADHKIAFSKRGTLLLNGKRMNEMMRSAKDQDSPDQKAESEGSKEGSPDDKQQDKQESKQEDEPDKTEPEPAPAPEGEQPSDAVKAPDTELTREKTPDLAILRPNPHPDAPRAVSLSAMTADGRASTAVRTMYEYGDEKAAEWVVEPSIRVNGSIMEENLADTPQDGDSLRVTKSRQNGDTLRSASIVSRPASMISKEPHELAGGIEDWEDIDGAEVDRRLVDEASDMLTLPPGLAAIAEERDGGRTVEMMKRKEWQREEKWRKMGKLVGKSPSGGGMLFEFDTKSPKLIERTWKGIPDRWRSSAWYAFLTASAKKDPTSPSDEELVEAFYELQEEDSAEDMQIDMDVPRTISHHIMFRKRYRGGQRLLFRVLHAFSLYLPDTGYVQGMAALGATLLCYYDEETAFIMLVRLWKLRGLERLYQSGFEGLMEALGDFEKYWLGGGEVSQKLEELGVHCTAYGTRWYLTLFNYSIPFPAQLRVWDVFMLLGDAATACDPDNSFHADLDVLHATSAALIDATREILLDSDFEVAMKTLTSWIPVKDEDLLMRVARAEWKQRKKRAKANPAAG
ncbi:putative tbc domain protein [Neofusicoccum parvum UCRNP2]|uniref:Putative tbc domain protein n=1 Tax=Botryosphaeria parva (strain UCR-NP2) TaxID=1287680 RepID=R1GAI2_BOTPV|nr:putative tbc domain protein [Neofusicoccum parvum UCRNP2]